MSDSYAFHTLDVFTDTIFGGNPLAVLTDARGLNAEQMSSITREFNLSETVFVFPPDDASHSRRLRIFTPGRELPFAGHPTVGTAHLLAATGMIPLTEGGTRIIMEEGVGPVPVTIRVQNGAPVSAELTAAQPAEFRSDAPSVHDIAQLLSITDSDVSTEPFAAESVSCGVPFLLLPLRSRDAVGRAMLNRPVWERVVRGRWAPEVFLFDASAVSAGTAIRARMFAPALGVGEDPATGSAAVCLAAYLAAHNAAVAATPALRWTVEQGFEMGRPSILHISAERDGDGASALRVAGQSVLVSSGTLRVT